jgi:hypothetical protein
MARRVAVLALLAALVLLPAATASPRAAGLHGFVRKGPLTPVCYAGVPCDGPAANVLLVFTRADGHTVRTRTRETGFYRVAVPPGSYRVTAVVSRPQTFEQRAVRAREGLDGRLDFHIDTGRQ